MTDVVRVAVSRWGKGTHTGVQVMDEGTQGFCAGFGIGGLVVGYALLIVGGCCATESMEATAVERGAAHYDSKTGEFTWNQETTP